MAAQRLGKYKLILLFLIVEVSSGLQSTVPKTLLPRDKESLLNDHQNVAPDLSSFQGRVDGPGSSESKETPPAKTFAAWDGDRKLCILAKFEAEFTIIYYGQGREQYVTIDLPNDAQTKGRCGTSSTDAVLELSWSVFGFIIIFKQIPGENWAISSLELQYDTDSALFNKATNAGKKTARNEDDSLFFETPLGKSYFCHSPNIIPLYDSKQQKIAFIRFKNVQMQPLGIKGSFSAPQRCPQVQIGGLPAALYVQDEAVPITVGSLLAVLAVLVVVGYALYRSVTVRRTDYNSME